MSTPTDQEYVAGAMDHAAKRVLIILIVGFVLLGFVASWAQL
jgi:hypothetical protein